MNPPTDDPVSIEESSTWQISNLAGSTSIDLDFIRSSLLGDKLAIDDPRYLNGNEGSDELSLSHKFYFLQSIFSIFQPI